MILPKRFTYPFCYTPHPLIAEAAARLIAEIDASPGLKSLFAEGKMLGVLMVSCGDENDKYLKYEHDDTAYLFAFSGLAGGLSMVDGFVPPVYDLTAPEGHYRKTEAVISGINRRLESIDMASELGIKLREERKQLSEELQDWIFRQYIVHDAKGGSASIKEVFARKWLVPPGGTGECAAPKLLQHAYLHGHKPLAMGEFWYGAPPRKEIRRHGCFYPSCTGKCGPLLSYMLEGLDVDPNPLEADSAEEFGIIYEDSSIIVVNKPAGMLSVPGRTGSTSLLELLQRRDRTLKIYSCHRLDMDTSGIMVYARNAQAQKEIQRQFENRETSKTYLALLTDGPSPVPCHGTIDLPIAPDWYDRPRQKADTEEGRTATTEFWVTESGEADGICRTLGWEQAEGEVLVRFSPLTGRSHQLRVHSAHHDGLDRPIKGDRLYGGSADSRLHLHAESIKFKHPETGEMLFFKSF